MNDKPSYSLFKIISATVLLVLIIVFALQNNTNTIVNLWFWKPNAPLILLFLMCFIAGLFFSLLALGPLYKHYKRKTRLIKELQERIEFLEKK